MNGQHMAKATTMNPTVRKRRRRLIPKKLRIFLGVCWILFAVGVIAASAVAYPRLQKAAATVPKIEGIMQVLNSTPSVIESADGVRLYSVQTEYRRAIHRRDMPNNVVYAVLAAEDKRFLDHNGIDFMSIGRIVFLMAKEGADNAQGASTITMQVAKRVFTGDARTLERKLDNMALAVEMERSLTKDKILEIYVNESYFGEGAYGIAAAADVYFGKSLDQLSIGEAATLARCVRRPSTENPRKNPKKAKFNRDLVLRTMFEEGFISEKEYKAALAEEMKVRAHRPDVLTGEKIHPYFVDYVLSELKKKGIDISKGGYRVVTTLDTRAQKIAEKGVKKWVREFRGYGVNQMAFLCTDNQGGIIAMVGGPDYEKSQFNMIWNGPGRQPGSSFKPFVYAAGLELGTFSSGSSISTKAMKKPGTNEYFKGGANRGYISIQSALASSNNTAAVRAMDDVGPYNVVRYCRSKLGFHESNMPEVISLALGSGEVKMTEMAAGYSAFQNHGDRFTPRAISLIVAPDGEETEFKPQFAKGVISAETADYIDGCLRTVVTSGTGRAASGVTNARGKTGTTSNHKDVWFVGYTDKFIGIIWAANERIVNGRPVAATLRGLYGGHGAAPAWRDLVGQIQDEIGEKSRRFGNLPYVNNEPRGDDDLEPPEDPDPVVPEEPKEEIDPNVVRPPDAPGDETVPRPVTGGTTGGTPPDEGKTPPPNNDPPRRDPPRTGGGGAEQRNVVYVSVCADSGQKANGYCPEVAKRPFFKGTEPKGSCPLHGR